MVFETPQIDELVLEIRISSALAVELRLSFTSLSVCKMGCVKSNCCFCQQETWLDVKANVVLPRTLDIPVQMLNPLVSFTMLYDYMDR